MSRRLAIPLLLALAASAPPAAAVVNPDLSVIGQPSARWTDDPVDPSRKRATFHQGEVELVFDAYLNPYAKGYVVGALGEDGLELEESHFTLLRGLPWTLQLRGGKYRVGLGKLNPLHPHELPFAERPRVIAAYLPGEEAFADVGASVSGRIPLPGTFSLTAAGDWLQGDSFRTPREPTADPADPLLADPEGGDRAGEARPAFVAALSGFGMLGERSGYEVTLGAAGGTNHVAASARTRVYDAAGKLKLWTADQSYLLVQAEVVKLDREVVRWDTAAGGYAATRIRPAGGYAFADYRFDPRYDAGLFYERYQQPAPGKAWDQAFGAFVGLALMEETTSFRLDWNHFVPAEIPGAGRPRQVNTVTLRVLFSMGPHKPHPF